MWVEFGEIGTIGYSNAFFASEHKQAPFYTSWRQNYFETIDQEGNTLPFGERGRIIVTRLTTFIQPLIRYDLEDEGNFFIKEGEIVIGEDLVKL